MSTDTPGPRRVRASDAEREELAELLRSAMTEGRLTLEEGEERLAKAYAAQYRDELGPLTADLPDGGREAWFQARFDSPEAVAAARRHLGRHAGFVIVVAAVLVTLWALSGAHFFWPLLPLLFLGFGLARHARWQRWGGRWGGGPWRGGWPGHWLLREWQRGGDPQPGGPPWRQHGGPPWGQHGEPPWGRRRAS